MTSSSKVLKIVDDPLVSQTVLEVIKEIDRQDVVSPNIYQSQLEAAKILVGDWILGWGNDEDAMERFEDLFDVTETEIERAEDEAYEETADDPEPFQVAIRIAHNWLEAAQEKNGSCVDEFVVLVYKLSMSSISAPLRRRKMVKKMSNKVVASGIIAATLLCVTAIIVMYGAYVPALFTGGLMIIGLVSTIDSLRILINAKREWQIA